MLKLIYKNILAHRGRYCWIFIELCLVALIGWAMLDDFIVNTYKQSISPGYDLDRLASFTITSYPFDSSDENDEGESADELFVHINRILDRVRSDSRVEAATFVNSSSFMQGSVSINSIPADDERFQGIYYKVHFWPNTDFFKTFGIRDAYSSDGSIFEEPQMAGRDLIVSESVGRYLFGEESAVGHNLEEKYSGDKDVKLSRIVGVVSDCVYRPDFGITPIVYNTRKIKNIGNRKNMEEIEGVLRLKSGVDVDKFIEDYGPVLATDIKSGPLYTHSLISYRDRKKKMSHDMTNQSFIQASITVFFLVNILLCMFGTFYLQTRKRSEETGVMRTFGASRGFILREMIGEGVLFTTVAWLLGCFIYWLYIKDEGLAHIVGGWSENSTLTLQRMVPMWTDDFNFHFAVISLIILVLMLFCTIAGIYIPARKIANINPVDALRDE